MQYILSRFQIGNVDMSFAYPEALCKIRTKLVKKITVKFMMFMDKLG